MSIRQTMTLKNEQSLCYGTLSNHSTTKNCVEIWTEYVMELSGISLQQTVAQKYGQWICYGDPWNGSTTEN